LAVLAFTFVIAYFWYSDNKEKEKQRLEKEKAMEERLKQLEKKASKSPNNSS
jgi:hypothetical protein